jgi:transcriptional regulator with XRE-family HTH domain
MPPASLVDKSVGSRIRSRRIELGLSQDHLASALGTTVAQIGSWEAGTSRIGASRLWTLAKFLDVPPWFFFEETYPESFNREDGPTISPGPDPLLGSEPSLEVLRLLRAFAGIEDSADRQVVIDLAETLAATKSVRN